jgi:hypothetical protein
MFKYMKGGISSLFHKCSLFSFDNLWKCKLYPFFKLGKNPIEFISINNASWTWCHVLGTWSTSQRKNLELFKILMHVKFIHISYLKIIQIFGNCKKPINLILVYLKIPNDQWFRNMKFERIEMDLDFFCLFFCFVFCFSLCLRSAMPHWTNTCFRVASKVSYSYQIFEWFSNTKYEWIWHAFIDHLEFSNKLKLNWFCNFFVCRLIVSNVEIHVLHDLTFQMS